MTLIEAAVNFGPPSPDEAGGPVERRVFGPSVRVGLFCAPSMTLSAPRSPKGR